MAVPGKRSPSGGTAKHEQEATRGPRGQVFGRGRLVRADDLDAGGMVRRKAQEGVAGGGRFRQLAAGQNVPALRVRGAEEGRVREEDRAADPRVRVVRPEVQPPGRDDLRFQEDTVLRMGRVPRRPLPVPFRRDVGVRQQERRFHRVLLARQDIPRRRRRAGRDRLRQDRLRRRDLLPPVAVEGREEGREGAARPIEEPVLRLLRDRRIPVHAVRVRRGQAEREQGHQRVRRPHSQRGEDRP